MTISTDSHMVFTLVDAPFERVLPVAVGVARALWGPVALYPNDRRRARTIQQDQATRHAGARLAIALPGLSIRATPDGRTLVEDCLRESLARAISVLLPEASVLGLESWTEGKVRSRQRMVVFREGRRLRTLGANKGTDAHGWTWEEAGAPTPWEDPSALTARSISARLTRAELWAVARRFGIDIEAVLADPSRAALAVEFLSHYDPTAPDLVSEAHIDVSRQALEKGIGDPLNLEPFRYVDDVTLEEMMSQWSPDDA